VLALPGYECGDVIQDPGFDLWCGAELCAWELEKGTIERVPTWHERDFGVELIGDQVVMSQLAEVNGLDVTCIRYEMIADIEDTATLTLEMDLGDDGTIDWQRQIPSSDWALLSYLVTLPTDYQGIRFRIRKEGPGRTILAEIEAVESQGCVDDPIPAAADCARVGDGTTGGPCR
jgi:hypothetical protein